MSDFFDFMKECLLPIFALLLLALAMVVAITWPFEYYKCSAYQEATGREVKHIYPAGCFVKSNSQFMPVKEFEKRALTNE